MDSFSFEIVRPDRLLHEGEATSMVLVTKEGELGVLAGHASEISVLGDGILRLEHAPNEKGQTKTRVVVKGGYAEITPDKVIVLADHARDIDDISPEVVEQTRQDAALQQAQLGELDSRRAYYDEKIAWCDLLLAASTGELK